jgi:drug/metabolite transporter (DMT)-like permease
VTTIAALLIFASVALHVSWNAISKQVEPTPAFFLLASIVSSLALSPVLVWQSDVAAEAFRRVLPVLVPTALCSASYNVALARAYRSGDLSVIYPLARSLSPVGIALASAALGRGAAISPGCAAGIGVIVVGSIFLPLDRIGSFRLAAYRTPAFLAALATAAATVGYTLLDDQALRILRHASGLGLGKTEQSLLYASMHSWSTTLLLGTFVLVRPSERAALPRVVTTAGRQALIVGIFGYTSYILILLAMGYVTDVTYVAGFRQLGIPLALAVAALGLRERMTLPRVVGGALCTVGLVLIATR